MKVGQIVDSQQYVVQEMPIPAADGYHVIMKVVNCGICGSDLHMWELGAYPPYKGVIPGHEHAGIVVDPGGHPGLKAGDRITSIPVHTPCGKCVDCVEGRPLQCKSILSAPGIHSSSPGSNAEYFKVSPRLVRKLPDSVSFSNAAMIEPATTTYTAVKGLNIRKGDRVLISGGGMIGAMTAQWCKYLGAEYVAMTEVNEFRGQWNLEHGNIDELFDGRDPELIPKLAAASGPAQSGFKKYIECSGNATALNTALKVCGEFAEIGILGVFIQPVQLDFLTPLFRNFNMRWFIGYDNGDFDWIMNLIAAGKFKVDDYHTGDCTLEEVQDMYVKLHDPACREMKVMIRFD